MQVEGRGLGKAERQRLIGSLISRKRVGTQFELLDALARAGCRVTQATGSRADPREALTAVLGQFGRRATAAENIVVLQSELGTAPAIARALDRLEHPRIVGTLAGDDTVLIVARDPAHPRSVAADLAQAI